MGLFSKLKPGGILNIIKKFLPAVPLIIAARLPVARRSDLMAATPLLGACMSGGMLGAGLAIPSSFTNACTAFSNSGLSGLCQTALNACGPAVQSALGSLPGGLSGIASGQLEMTLGELGINTDNVVGGCLEQAQSCFANGVPGMAEICQSVQGFCETSFDMKALMSQCSNLNLPLGDLGFSLDSLKNTITGGITAQFGPLTDNFKTVCTNLSNLGTMCDPSNLTKSFTPAGFAENLINQGFGQEILGELEKVGISNIQDLVGANDKLITQALDAVPKSVVDQIVSKTGFNGAIESLSDVINKPVTWLGEQASQLVNSGAELGEKLSNVLGVNPVANNFGEIGSVLKQVQEPNTPLLDIANSDRNNWQSLFATSTQSNPLLGSGSGLFGNPTISDVIGVVAGIGYTTQILNMSSSQQRLLATTQGQALQSAINSAISNPGNDAANAAAITAAAQPFINPTDSIIANELTSLNQEFNSVAQKIITEKQNLNIAGIDPEDYTGSSSSVLAWVNDLHTIYDDPRQLGYANFIRALTTQDIYGEAIRAAIIEGQNLALLKSIGVVPPTSLDTVKYIQQVKDQAATMPAVPGCCPPVS